MWCQLRQYVLNIFICRFNLISPESTRELLEASSTYVFHLLPKRPCILKDLVQDPRNLL